MSGQIDMCATPSPRPWYERAYRRVVYKLFSPGGPFPWPQDDQQVGHGVCVEVAIVFDWKDRLRILFGGIPWARSVVSTENDPGKSATRTVVCVERPATRPAKDKLWKPKAEQ